MNHANEGRGGRKGGGGVELEMEKEKKEGGRK